MILLIGSFIRINNINFTKDKNNSQLLQKTQNHDLINRTQVSIVLKLVSTKFKKGNKRRPNLSRFSLYNQYITIILIISLLKPYSITCSAPNGVYGPSFTSKIVVPLSSTSSVCHWPAGINSDGEKSHR